MEGVCGVIVYRTYQFDEFETFSSISISITCWMVLPTNCVLYNSSNTAEWFIISSVLCHSNIQSLPPAPTVPPGRPENLAFPSIEPYSVNVTWDPPSDDGGTPDPLNYMVALTTTSDGQSVSANQTTQTQLTFTALSHSENYTVSVVAVNSLGRQGPSAVGTFRTRDIRE